MQNQIKGKIGEELVMAKLQKEGFTICSTNFRKADGEIDIIASKENLLIFVEVKTRINDTVDLGELIGKTKRKKIITTAYHFLAQSHDAYNDCVCRFDAALVTLKENVHHIDYLPNAFFEHE